HAVEALHAEAGLGLCLHPRGAYGLETRARRRGLGGREPEQHEADLREQDAERSIDELELLRRELLEAGDDRLEDDVGARDRLEEEEAEARPRVDAFRAEDSGDELPSLVVGQGRAVLQRGLGRGREARAVRITGGEDAREARGDAGRKGEDL